MRREEGQCESSLGEKTLLNTNPVVVYPQTTLTLYMFFYDHVVVEFKIYIFFSLWFQTSTLALRQLSILEQQLEGGTSNPLSLSIR